MRACPLHGLRRRVFSGVISFSPTPINLPTRGIHTLGSLIYYSDPTLLCLISFRFRRAAGIQSP